MAQEIEVRPLAYNIVAASQPAQALVRPANSQGIAAGTGAHSDILETLLVMPATTSPGVVTVIDGGTSIPVWPGGTVADLKPFLIVLGVRSQSTAWKITTGANVSVVAAGRFS